MYKYTTKVQLNYKSYISYCSSSQSLQLTVQAFSLLQLHCKPQKGTFEQVKFSSQLPGHRMCPKAAHMKIGTWENTLAWPRATASPFSEGDLLGSKKENISKPPDNRQDFIKENIFHFSNPSSTLHSVDDDRLD